MLFSKRWPNYPYSDEKPETNCPKRMEEVFKRDRKETNQKANNPLQILILLLTSLRMMPLGGDDAIDACVLFLALRPIVKSWKTTSAKKRKRKA